ncbi:MAG TPA: hypothetical protein VF660_03745, partial [Actinomycetota bacterium]
MNRWIARSLLTAALMVGALLPATGATGPGTVAARADDPCVSDSGSHQVDVGGNQVNVDTPVAVNCDG